MGNMSRFSLVLQSCIEEWGISQKDLVLKSRIPKSTLSKFTRGKLPISPSKLHQLCLAFPEIYRPRLLKAFLEDQIPDWGKSLVQIDFPLQHRLREEKSSVAPYFPSEALPLPLQKVFSGLVRLSIEKPPVRDLMVKLHGALVSPMGTH